MASLPPAEEVAGPFLPQYDWYYRRLDPDGKNEIGPGDLVAFLKKSGLSDEILGKIWDLSDVRSAGSLDRAGLFVACKLVALVQDHQDCMACNLLNECPAPNFGDSTAPGAPTTKPVAKPTASIHFLVKPEEKRKYDALFDQLQPQDEKLPGDKVRNVMLGSKLPMPTLGKVWDLSDMDRDGFLDRYEFTVAMHLIYRALQGDAVPNELPAELARDKVPKSLSQVASVSSAINQAIPNAAMGAPTFEAVPWVVNQGDRYRFATLFHKTDSDKDGYVSGIEIKNLFLQTGLPQNILAHIWNLCDMKQEGKLNPEQFALAMWLIARKQAGKDPPAALTPDMIPPSMRDKDKDTGMASIYKNPELEMIAKEIQAMLVDKLQVEKEVQDVDYNISVKRTEITSLQGEYDTLAATLKQLTNQKEVAQKRLDDLDVQRKSLNDESTQAEALINEQLSEIDKLKSQSNEQEETLSKLEEEVYGKKRELERLKEEERELRTEIKRSEKDATQFEADLKLIADLYEEAKEKMEMLDEAERHMNNALKAFENASDDCSNVAETFLEPLRLSLEMPDFSRLDKPKRPPIPEAPSAMTNSTVMNGESNGFGHGHNVDWANNDAFAAFDQRTTEAWHPSASSSSLMAAAAASDFDPFAAFSAAAKDPFGGGSAFSNNSSTSNFDAFGFDSFGAKSRPSGVSPDYPPEVAPRPDDSPTPALPPKGAGGPKRPPPPRRPPPPGGGGGGRAGPPLPPPPKSGANSPNDDPFGGAHNDGGAGGFADFASFDTFGSSSNSHKFDSAFSSPTHAKSSQNMTMATRPTMPASASFPDSAFSSAQATPIDFAEDPFKNSEHRYGDPFELSDADPFKGKEDPFTAQSVSAAFGVANDPFLASSNDPFSLTLNNSLKQQQTSDPFPSSNDPFKSSGNSNGNKYNNFGQADWGFSSPPKPTSSSSVAADPFSPFRSKDDLSFPKTDGVPMSIKAGKSASKSMAVNWDRPRPELSDDPFSPSILSKVGVTGLESGRSRSNSSKTKSSSSAGGSSEEKKKHRWVPKLSSSGSKAEKASKAAAAAEDLHVRMAADASRRAEDDRMRRLRLQEEQDLAYAIALSKAEAASLNNT